MVFEIDDFACLCIDFIAVLILCRVKLQHPAGTTLVAAQLLLGKDHLLFRERSVHAGVLQGDGSCFLQRQKQRCLVLCKDVAVDRVDAVVPLRLTVAEHQAVVGIPVPLVNQPCLGKGHFYRSTARIAQRNRLCLRQPDVPGVDHNRVKLLLQSDQLVQRQLCKRFLGQRAVFRRVTDELRLPLGNAVPFRDGCGIGIVRFGNIHQGMHGGFGFKHLTDILCHGFLESAVFAQPSVEGNQNRVVSFHISADFVCGKRKGYGTFQMLSLQRRFTEHFLRVLVQKTHRTDLSVFRNRVLHPGVDFHRYLSRFPVSERDRGNDADAERQHQTRRQRRNPLMPDPFLANPRLRVGSRNQPVVNLTDYVQQSFSFHK